MRQTSAALYTPIGSDSNNIMSSRERQGPFPELYYQPVYSPHLFGSNAPIAALLALPSHTISDTSFPVPGPF